MAAEPIAFEKGSGIWLIDTQGEKYLDALAGIAVCGLGHAHPAITETICKQAAKLIHTSNTYHILLTINFDAMLKQMNQTKL